MSVYLVAFQLDEDNLENQNYDEFLEALEDYDGYCRAPAFKADHVGSIPITPSTAGVAELADARDLKSCENKISYRFDSGPRHHVR